MSNGETFKFAILITGPDMSQFQMLETDGNATTSSPPQGWCPRPQRATQIGIRPKSQEDDAWAYGAAGDLDTASLIESWIDQAQRRSWLLFEATRSQEI